MSLCFICRAIRADALDLYGRGGGLEAPRPGRLIDRHADAVVAHLEDPAAGRADQKLRGGEPVMGVIGTAVVEHVRAADEGREALDLMNQTLRGQELQRTVHRGRSGRAAILPQPVEQIIGTGGTGIVEDEAKDQPPLFREAQAAVCRRMFRLDRAIARCRM